MLAGARPDHSFRGSHEWTEAQAETSLCVVPRDGLWASGEGPVKLPIEERAALPVGRIAIGPIGWKHLCYVLGRFSEDLPIELARDVDERE